MPTPKKRKYILWFDEIRHSDVALVGGKNASLGEMTHALKRHKIPIPYGFAVTSYAYQCVISENQVLPKLQKALANLNPKDTRALMNAGKRARALLMQCSFPDDLKDQIILAYKKLASFYAQTRIDVAVRSSATAEDLPSASFAGQQESFLNILGEKQLLHACKRCFASLFTDRAIAYRAENNIDHFTTSLSIGIQKMVRSDQSSAGVMFSLDTETGFKEVVFITGSYGLGENIVQGSVDPDEFYVFKPTLAQGYHAIIDRVMGRKETKIIYGKPIKKQITSKRERNTFCLTEDEIHLLATWTVNIETHFSKIYKQWTPVDVEWAKDGKSGKLFIVQARPETVESRKKSQQLETFSLSKTSEILLTGKSVGHKIGQGKVRIILDIKDMDAFKPKEVLVTDMTNPDWVPIMRSASAIVTNRGGRTSHAAIVSRELGLPCIVGTEKATEILHTGQKVTIDCTQEELGIVYQGLLPIKKRRIHLSKFPDTKTKLMINAGQPDEAFAQSFLPHKGVGLAREEFIISQYVKIHPMALIYPEKILDPKIKHKIEELTKSYSNKAQFFIDKLAMGIAKIAAAFYPQDVILRFSDFKTNEYSHLIGGEFFEPKEENPMIGWRGASRYYTPGYKEGFSLECAAIKKVREEMGFINLKVMIPVCRTVEEGKKVLLTMKQNHLEQGKHGLEVYMMCEIPSNVLLAKEFCTLFDGLSIGSNDLTQMILGVDRDNEHVASLFDERNDAVKKMIKEVIMIAKEQKCKIGICGEAPALYPEFTKFLIDCGIDSISVNASAFLRVKAIIAQYEQELLKKKR